MQRCMRPWRHAEGCHWRPLVMLACAVFFPDACPHVRAHGPRDGNPWPPAFVPLAGARPFSVAGARPLSAASTRERWRARPITAAGGDGAGVGAAGSALSALIEKARHVAQESWRLQESEGEMQSRSASGGTSWADGSWIDRNLEAELEEMMNSTRHYEPAFAWLKRSPDPTSLQLWEGPEASIALHLIPPQASMRLPWQHPTGSKVLCRTLFGKMEVVQLLGDPHGRRPMRQATRLHAAPEAILKYMGGPPRLLGSGEAAEGEATAVVEVALHSKGYMERSVGGFLVNAVGFEGIGAPVSVTLPPAVAPSLFISPAHPVPPIPAGYPPLIPTQGTGAEGNVDGKPEWEEEGLGATEDVEALDLAVLETSIGGEREALEALLRRAVLSRQMPQLADELGMQHVRGVLLYGPPGCGKTLLARTLASALKARPPVVLAGPELLDRWVGEAERRVRALFHAAREEWAARGARSALHVIIIDEIDAITRARGSLNDATGVRDSIVAQLLSVMDGVDPIDNVLLIGLTNRRALIDPALLRPGRFEVQLEIRLPDAAGRVEIIKIHLNGLRQQGRLAPGVWDKACAVVGASHMQGWSGAEIAGVGAAGLWGDVCIVPEDIDKAIAEVSTGRPVRMLRASSSLRARLAALFTPTR